MSGFEDYVDLRQVGTGSTAVVFCARQVELDRLVAVKELLPPVRTAPGLLERFRGEAATLASLDDPHVVRLLDYLEDARRAWIVQQWVPGASLTTVLDTNGRLSAEQALGVLRGGLLGLAHAHDRGVVHRDVAPGNVLLDLEGTAKLVDFGLAAPVGSSTVLGTPAFVSPEAARGEPVGPAGDVYSAAATLFLLLTGRPPFPASDPVTVLRRHVEDPVPVLEGHGPRLADVLSRALAKDPEVRPPDARALLAELEDAAEERYGPAWLTRSSVAGLVASASAAGGGALGTGPAADAPAPAGTAQLTTAATFTGAAVASAPITADAARVRSSRRPRPRTRRTALAVGAAVLVAGAGVAVAVTSLAGPGSSTDDAPAADEARAGTAGRPASAAPTPSVSPSPALGALNGTWVVRYEVVSNSQPEFYREASEAVGQVTEEAVQLALRCTEDACTGPLIDPTGTSALAQYDGEALTASSSSTYTGPCIDVATGLEEPGTSATITEQTLTRLSTSSAAADGTPTGFEGTQTVTGEYSQVSAVCQSDFGFGPFVLTRRVTLRRS